MVNQTQGEKSLEQILDIINNKEVYAKYLKEIKSVRDDIDYKLSLIEKSGQIEKLYDKAKKNEQHANEALTKAKEAADALERGSMQTLRDKEAYLNTRAERISDEEKVFSQDKNKLYAELSVREKELARKEKAVSSLEHSANTLNSEAQALIEQFERKKKVLDKAAEELS